MPAQNLAHAALDAVALVRLAQHLAGGEPDARAGLRASVCGARNQLIEGGLAFAAGRIGALIVGVLAQTRCQPATARTLQRLRREGLRLRLARKCSWQYRKAICGQMNGGARNLTPAETERREEDLVAEAGADRDALAAGGTAAAQHGCAALVFMRARKPCVFTRCGGWVEMCAWA